MVACSGRSDDDGRIGVVQAVAPMLGFEVWGGDSSPVVVE
jgi:hypothetical protein